ncbi:DUF1795 domain-containing protein [Affinibrenneria salicis]|uniref:DUF1795 domain-containing protein n=1 Tax=Affinibrenneria salicis TaxID=2590031 RepID=A0A5J5G748_9GAMM|nr:DUF1795 domain-containing protein [Affinibrenneria salicis]KAA9002646.1 DUF1795 domain-containing protein [Affinibrenneria salicis]KAA9003066.1 DUF1795 domain-containing protein [Affinibrenneria salicis]
MPFSSTRCQFTEGSVALPEGYLDRTVNVFAPAAADSASFNIARDTLPPDETLSAYIDRQLSLLGKHLKGWKERSRAPAQLGQGEQALNGECVQASYLRDGQRVWQQQAVFAPGNGLILVFTQSVGRALTEQDKAQFADLLNSFTRAAS